MNTRKKKIVYISSESFLEPAYEHLKQLSHFCEVLFIYLFANDEICIKKIENEFPALVIKNRYRQRSFYWIYKEIYVLFRILKFRPEAVWYEPISHPIQSVSVILFRILGIKLLVSIHDVQPHVGRTRFDWILLTKLSYILFNNIIVFSSFSVNVLKTKYPKKKIFYKSLAFYSFTDFSKKRILPCLGKVVLFFGGIYEYKNVNLLIQAARALEKEKLGIKFVIAGEDKKHLLHIHSSSLIEYHLRFIQYEEVEKYFRNCRIVVIPYLSATQAGPLLNSYYYEKPVIASRLKNFEDYVKEKTTGLFFKVGDVKELCKRIKMLCLDDNSYLTLVKNIRERKEYGQFSFGEQCKKLESIFDAL